MNTQTLTNFITLLQKTIATDSNLSPNYNTRNIYRRSVPTVKEPSYPLIAISYDRNGLDAGTDIESIRVRFTVIDKTELMPETTVGYLQDLLPGCFRYLPKKSCLV